MTTQSIRERPGAVTFRGQPMTLVGDELRPGMPAPSFVLSTVELAPFTLGEALDDGSRNALLITVPSLDTGVCSTETVTFNRRIGELPKSIATFAVSVDLPFAQTRWAKEHDVSRIALLSAYRNPEFAPSYGVLVKELALLARAVFVIRKDGIISYATIVPEIAQEPNYEEVFGAANAVA